MPFSRWLRSVLLVSLLAVGVTSNAFAQTVTLAWDPSAGADGYMVRWGTALGNYPNSANAGNDTTFTFTNLTPGETYYAIVEAYTGEGDVSDPSNALQFVVQAEDTPPPSNLPKFDLNQDGRPDMIWQHVKDGYVAAWTMANEKLKNSLLTSPGRVPDTAWRIVGSGDFNGDTKPDLVWQHKAQGWLAVWLMDGLNLIESASMQPYQVSDTRWEIASIADLNGDGKSDLVWQERSGGWIAVWLMNGTQLAKSLGLSPEQVSDTAWRIVGAADMNGDGKQDLVWHHAKDGYIAAWLMNGTKLIESVLLQPGRVTDPNWSVIGVADANLDGKADLYWRDRTTGHLALWYMNGIKLSKSIGMKPERVSDIDWHVVSVR